ncbi:flavin reductase family protein [Afipia sp. P52-10]|uniref:flavin reductase family protein n=1 Tax=Afipia sp. P52-10 TaxID=1429916 RepID=UPI0004B11E53|nr:flavin reductase family protein [Afipia sp. P52-10]
MTHEIRPTVGAQDFMLGMRQVVSSVAIVTARADGVRNGLTATAVCSVSAEPPTILVCVNRNASAEPLIAAGGCFGVNFLADTQEAIARAFSTSKLSADQRFEQGAWREIVTGAPILDGAVASFDCSVREQIVAGTHHIYIGRVMAASFVDQGALLYRSGTFRRLGQLDCSEKSSAASG